MCPCPLEHSYILTLQAGVTISNLSILLLANPKMRTTSHFTAGVGMKASSHPMKGGVHREGSNYITIPVFRLGDTPTW